MRSSHASNRARSEGVNSRVVSHSSACSPECTSPKESPSFSKSPVSTNLPANTPIEPVIVPGCATILSAPIATK